MKTLSQVSILFIFLVFASCSGQEEKETTAQTAKYVKIERVSDGGHNDKMIFNGKVKEKSLTTLSFRVGGPLVKLEVKAGDFVRKGQTVAAIDKRDYQLQLQAKKAQYEQLKGEYTRYKELHEKGKIPTNSFEKIESGYLMSKTAYENAVNQLKDTELKAPVSGYIHKKLTENFQTVGPGQPIVSVIDLSQLEVVVSVPENKILSIKECEKNLLTVKNANIKNEAIQLFSVGEKTQDDGLYEVKFLVNNQNEKSIRPGMSAEVAVFHKSKDYGMSVPSTAVFFHNNDTYVWVYYEDSKTIGKRKVEAKEIQTGGTMKITSGLKYDELIVTAGVHSLQESQTVKPIRKPEATNIGGLL